MCWCYTRLNTSGGTWHRSTGAKVVLWEPIKIPSALLMPVLEGALRVGLQVDISNNGPRSLRSVAIWFQLDPKVKVDHSKLPELQDPLPPVYPPRITVSEDPLHD
jgi:hypothetical protein